MTERVIPHAILALPTPTEVEAHRGLVDLAAQALGIATAAELRDYFRLGVAETARAIAELVEAGRLLCASVPGWPAAFLHAEARCPRRIAARALLAPFDPLVWQRARAERLFGFRYRIEIYTPADKRQYGYYVLPFLLNEALVGRVDLKADRAGSALLVQSVHLEPGAPPDTLAALNAELGALAGWLGLGGLG